MSTTALYFQIDGVVGIFFYLLIINIFLIKDKPKLIMFNFVYNLQDAEYVNDHAINSEQTKMLLNFDSQVRSNATKCNSHKSN